MGVEADGVVGWGGRGGGAYCIGVSAGLLVKAAPGPPAPLKQWDQPRSEEQDVPRIPVLVS